MVALGHSGAGVGAGQPGRMHTGGQTQAAGLDPDEVINRSPDEWRPLVDAAEREKVRYHTGITASCATFYQGQERYDSASGYVPRRCQGALEEWRALNVLNYEMEAATLFTMCRTMGLAAAAVCAVVANRTASEAVDREAILETEAEAIRVGIKGLEMYLEEHPR